MTKKKQELAETPKDQVTKPLVAPEPLDTMYEGVLPSGTQQGDLIVGSVVPMSSPAPSDPTTKTIEEYFQISRETEGWLTEAEMQLLWGAAHASLSPDEPNPIWAEAGSFKGKSTVILGAILTLNKIGVLFAIDPHEGKLSYPTHYAASGLLDTARIDDVGGTLLAFTHTILKAQLQDYIILKKMKSTDFERPEGQLSLLFLDGLHDYESVKADWEHFKPMLKDGATVIFHDYGQWEGVTRAVQEALKDGEFSGGQFADSLAVFTYRKS